MSFPLTDWQFYVVTAIFGLGLWMLIRPLVPSKNQSDSGCGNCAAGSAAQATKQASLTVEGRQVG